MAEVIEGNIAENQAVNVAEEKTQNNTQAETSHKPSPAQDLRNLQALLVMGIFPGQVAPQIVQAYSLLESMAKKIEDEAHAASK